MQSEKQYIDLYEENRQVIMRHSADALNTVRDKAFEDFKAQGFPTRKVERYKYTDIPKLFEPRLRTQSAQARLSGKSVQHVQM